MGNLMDVGRSRRVFPTLYKYQKSWLASDLTAGITAGTVVVPQAMAYATIAGLPVQVGLYSCIVPMLVYALLGGSRTMSVSTTSTIATLTATTLVSAGIAAGAEDQLGTLMTLSFLVGAFLLAAWALKLGGLVENISGATVLGVKIGVGGTVAVGQLPKLLGEDTEPTGEGFFRAIAAAIKAFDSISLPTVLLSLASIIVMVLMKRYTPRIPGTLVAAAGGVALVAYAHIDNLGVVLIDPVPSGLPIPSFPSFDHIIALIPGALAIAVMAFMESATVARSMREASEPAIDADRELLAAGLANLSGTIFPTLPAAGGLSQSAVNRNAGAQTQLAALITVGMAILIALFLGPIISLLPQATLAAMVVVAVASLIDIPTLIRWARISPIDFYVALVVAVIGLTAGLLPAVGAGVAITLILVLRELNIPEVEIIDQRGTRLALRLVKGLYTANVRANVAAILEIVATCTKPVDYLVLDVRRVDVVTITILDSMADLDSQLSAHGVELHLAGLPLAASTIASKTPWFQGLLKKNRVHPDVSSGLQN